MLNPKKQPMKIRLFLPPNSLITLLRKTMKWTHPSLKLKNPQNHQNLTQAIQVLNNYLKQLRAHPIKKEIIPQENQKLSTRIS